MYRRADVFGPCLALCCVVVCVAGSAQTQSAESIIRESDRRQQVQSQSYEGQLEVTDPGRKILKKTWQLSREGNGGTSKVLIRFNTPPEVDGVGLLVLARPGAPDEQWLYTPAIHRDRRIATQDRSARFMGTDFTHEDMEQRDIDEYAYELLGEESPGGLACWIIRAKPKQPGQSQYSWTDLWIRKDIYLPIAYEMFVDGKKRKRLDLSDIAAIQSIWTARTLRVIDLDRGSSTTLRLQNVKYNVPFAKDFFSQRTLRSQ